jgi:hypothetical protein
VAEGLNETELQARLFLALDSSKAVIRPLPDCEYIHSQLRDPF